MQLKLIAALVVATLTAGAGWALYEKGKEVVYAEWDAEKAATQIEASKKAVSDWNAANAVAQKVAAASVQDRVVYKTITKEIPTYVKVDDCPMSGGFRMLHDAAATGSLPDPGASGVNGTPVPAQDVATTITDNYEACRDNERRLRALQDVIRHYNNE